MTTMPDKAGEARTPQHSDTKILILDAAEALFAESGYYRTTMRMITSRAGVNLASVNYHFGSKEALLDAVLERRVVPMNAARLKMLEDIRAKARAASAPPGVRDIMRAFIEPPFRFRETEEGFAGFVRVLGHIFTDPDNTLRTKLIGLMEPVAGVFIEALCEARPDIDQETLAMRFHFAIGATVLTLFGCDDEMLDRGCCKPGVDPACLLVDFVSAGMEAPHEKA